MRATAADNSAGDDAGDHRSQSGNTENQAGRQRPEMQHILKVQRRQEDEPGLHREDGQHRKIAPSNRRQRQHLDRDQWRRRPALDPEKQRQQDQSDDQCGRDRWVMPKTRAKRPSVTDAAPGTSSRTPSGERPAGTTTGVSTRIVRATGTLIRNAQRQLSTPTSIPPASAPNVKPAESSEPFRPNTRARCLSSAKVVISSDSAAGAVIALGHTLKRPSGEKQSRPGRNAAQGEMPPRGARAL